MNFESWWPNGWTFGNMWTTAEEDRRYEESFKEVARQAWEKAFELGYQQGFEDGEQEVLDDLNK